MDDAKLPDLSRLRENHKPKSALPSQSSAQDTSNWDDRAFTTPDVSIDRELLFSMPKTDVSGIMANPYLEQERVKAENRSKKKNP